jgi:branched-chain amino acid transport system substrate-binding protein
VSGEEIEDIKRYDFSSELSTIFSDLPDVVLLINFDEVWQISNQIAQGGYLDAYGDTPPLFFGTDATFTSDLLINGNPDVLRSMEGTSTLADVESADSRKFRDNFAAAGLGSSEGFDATHYDAIYCVALAIQSAQSLDPQVFKHHLRMVANAEEGDAEIHVAEWAAAREALLNGETINYEGASGPIEFDEHGDPSSAFFVLYRLVDSGDGTFEYDLSNTVLFP